MGAGPESAVDCLGASSACPAAAPLIATKLGPPRVAPGWRERARLHEHLDAGLNDTTRLTLVSAPPGYGKSVAVAGWLASRTVPNAWLSLDAADNDPTHFERYLVAALEAVRPGIGESFLRLLGPGADASLDLVGAVLLDLMAVTDGQFALVLDDYHLVRAEAVHALVRFLIERGPPFEHIIVISREDPPFPLARLRAHGRLVEMRADALRFTEEEAAGYLAETAGVTLDAAHVARLLDRTEGWIAGVQLAAISFRGRTDAADLVDTFAGTQRFVLDYLASEVLEGLDPGLRDFLVRVAVADRFTVELCRELSGRDDSSALLDQVERLNLFLVPLGLECCWYRFHHLFAEYLRMQLDDGESRSLHERAADYFEREGLAGEAIRHALAAGSLERATRLVEGAARSTYKAGELTTLLGWLDALSPERVAASPELNSLRAHSAFQTGRVHEAAMACAAGKAARPDGPVSGPLLIVGALIAAFSNRADAIELGRAAVEATGDDTFFHARALHALATAYLSAGELRSVEETARAALDQETDPRRSTLVVPAITALVSALNLTGRRREAEALCRQTLENHRVEASRMAGGTPYALYWLGMVLYEAGDLAGAVDALERGWAAAGTFGFGRALLTAAVSYLSFARQATGSPVKALEAVLTVQRDARAAGLSGIEGVLAEIEARLRLAQGDVAFAARWADRAAHEAASEPCCTGLAALARDVTMARVRLVQGRTDEARRLLDSSRRWATAVHDSADLISIRVLDAAVAQASGDPAAGQRALEDAVRAAAPEGYLRRVVDDVRPVAHLLPAVRRVAPAFVDAAMTALVETPAATAGGPRRAGPSLWQDERGQPLEALTARELEVLRLMAGGRSDAAIAADLVVSLATAKWHAAHIRSKLGTASRTQALLRAQQLGLV